MLALFALLANLFFHVEAASEYSVSTSDDFLYDNLVESQTLISNYEFSSSWNKPTAVSFSPSIDANRFNRVVLELNVNTTGSNYDRLVMLFFDNMEIWRSSTPEPDSKGMSWSARKDVSHYTTLFHDSHTINLIFQNLVDGGLDGVFEATLIAHYYDDPSAAPLSDDTWAVDLNNLPSSITALKTSGAKDTSVWNVPSEEASSNVGPLDRSVNRALLHIFASSNGDDEFWWQATGSNPGPSRFINVYLNDSLAGIVSPFPTIFTGGLNPYLWKPIVGVRALDIPAYFIDITPFLPALWDGSTKVRLEIVNGINGATIPYSWILSMNLMTWATSGQVNSGCISTPSLTNKTSTSGSVIANYRLSNSAQLIIDGQQKTVQWSQNLAYNNTNSDNLYQNSVGSAQISGLYSFSWSYNFPITIDSDSSTTRVQQTYAALANNKPYYTWIDTQVKSKSDGSLDTASSAQYASSPGGVHYVSSDDLTQTSQW